MAAPGVKMIRAAARCLTVAQLVEQVESVRSYSMFESVRHASVYVCLGVYRAELLRRRS